MSNGRLVEYDYLRVVAMFAVVGCHTFSMAVSSEGLPGSLYTFVMSPFLLMCNALFFIMSGRFNVRPCKDNRGVGLYYLRKVRGILIPVIVWFVLRNVFETVFYGLPWSGLFSRTIHNSFEIYSGTSYWFIYSLIGYLLVAPFISELTRFRTPIVILGCLYSVSNFVLNNKGIDFAISYVFSGFMLLFCVGGLYRKEEFATRKRAIYALGAVSFLITLVNQRMGWTWGLNDASPFYAVTSIALYLALLDVFPHGECRLNRMVSVVSNHSFSVYFVHPLVITCMSSMLSPTGEIWCFANHFTQTLLVTLVSLIVSIIVDTTLIEPLKRLFSRATAPLERHLKMEAQSD